MTMRKHFQCVTLEEVARDCPWGSMWRAPFIQRNSLGFGGTTVWVGVQPFLAPPLLSATQKRCRVDGWETKKEERMWILCITCNPPKMPQWKSCRSNHGLPSRFSNTHNSLAVLRSRPIHRDAMWNVNLSRLCRRSSMRRHRDTSSSTHTSSRVNHSRPSSNHCSGHLSCSRSPNSMKDSTNLLVSRSNVTPDICHKRHSQDRLMAHGRTREKCMVICLVSQGFRLHHQHNWIRIHRLQITLFPAMFQKLPAQEVRMFSSHVCCFGCGSIPAWTTMCIAKGVMNGSFSLSVSSVPCPSNGIRRPYYDPSSRPPRYRVQVNAQVRSSLLWKCLQSSHKTGGCKKTAARSGQYSAGDCGWCPKSHSPICS